jgi:hypothetical protein
VIPTMMVKVISSQKQAKTARLSSTAFSIRRPKGPSEHLKALIGRIWGEVGNLNVRTGNGAIKERDALHSISARDQSLIAKTLRIWGARAIGQS